MRRQQISLKYTPLFETDFFIVFFIIVLKAEKHRCHLCITARENLLWQWQREVWSIAKMGIKGSIFGNRERRSPKALHSNAMFVMLGSCHGCSLETGLEELRWPFHDLYWREQCGQLSSQDKSSEKGGLVSLSVGPLRFVEGDISTLLGSLQNVGLREIYPLPRITKESHLDWISSIESHERE